MNAILLSPGLNKLHGLVPPVVVRWTSDSSWEVPGVNDPRFPAWELALVLAWDGKPVPEGIDRALRTLGIHEGIGRVETPGSLVESKNGDCFILWSGGKNLYYGKNQVPAHCSPDTLVIPWSERSPPEDLRHALNVATVCSARLGAQLVTL